MHCQSKAFVPCGLELDPLPVPRLAAELLPPPHEILGWLIAYLGQVPNFELRWTFVPGSFWPVLRASCAPKPGTPTVPTELEVLLQELVRVGADDWDKLGEFDDDDDDEYDSEFDDESDESDFYEDSEGGFESDSEDDDELDYLLS